MGLGLVGVFEIEVDGLISLRVPGLERPGRSLVQMPDLDVAVKTATWSLSRRE
jgi:hypothetical protein